MPTTTKTDPILVALRQLIELDKAGNHPAFLLRHMKCWDERAGVEFGFDMDGGPWGWQRDVVDWTQEHRRCIVLKARQIGVTWVGCGLGVWTALFKPGSLSLFYRQKEDDAFKLVQRAWYQFNHLPPHLRRGVEVLTPARGAMPKREIVLRFPDGRISRIQAQSSADASGHGETAAFVLLDEFARIDNAPEIMKAVSSAAGQDGSLFIISTANGVSNEQGGGNYFHYLWSHAEAQGLATWFLSWRLHPDRDDEWMRTSPEVLNLRPWERAEQYPDNPQEAFTLSSAHFFDGDAMYYYAEHPSETLYRCEFEETRVGKAKLVKKDTGWIRVFREPVGGRKYAIGADVSTGKGLDYSSAFVVDLSRMELCAEFHGKLDTDLYAEQLHYLGRWYNTAIVAVEDAGGFGAAITVDLRDRREGRPSYPNLYHHRQFVREDQMRHKGIGYPVTAKTKGQILGFMEQVLRERHLPDVPGGLLSEMHTFCRFNPHKPDAGTGWPKAWPEGLNDDRVMACAITLEMYRQKGEFEHKPRKRSRNLLMKAA